MTFARLLAEWGTLAPALAGSVRICASTHDGVVYARPLHRLTTSERDDLTTALLLALPASLDGLPVCRIAWLEAGSPRHRTTTTESKA